MQPQIALSLEFMEAYSSLPKKIQKKVRDFTRKFQEDPTQSGINFETVNGAIDPKVRSVRVDQAYRAIVVHPPKGDIYLCVWVDHHDDAYDWARRKRFEVNPLSGTFQLFEPIDAEAVAMQDAAAGLQEMAAPRVQESEIAYSFPGLFSGFDDEDLLLAGVPQALLPAIRAVGTEAQLEGLAPFLPRDTRDLVYMLAAGYTLIEALEELSHPTPADTPDTVDIEDFGSALERSVSRASFKVVEDEVELEEMLDAPLEKWRIFLHPSQRRIVTRDVNGPMRVLGGAGTGKTVVLIHRANHLASNVFTAPGDRLLVTTFTKNLALDLEHNLRNLCSAEAFARLEIVHLHRWAVRFMARHGHTFNFVSEVRRHEIMEQALLEAPDDDLPIEFYLEEWDRVVQANDVLSRDDYLTVPRSGRGTPLDRRKRAQVWPVLERYRELLEAQGLSEWQDLMREARMFLEKQPVTLSYRAVLADEVQDFGENELKLLRAIAPDGANNLFVVGDAHQRIYGHPVVMSRMGIEIRGRSRRLKLNYRTTEQIRRRAVAVLEGCDVDDLDGGLDTIQGYQSLREGPAPTVRQFESADEEGEFILKRLKSWIEAGVEPRSICLTVRSHSLLDDRYQPLLEAAGLDVVQVGRDPEQEAATAGVRLATMHRLKGLEFSRVIVASVQAGTVPMPYSEAPDSASEEEHLMRERCLLHVAMTRARDELVVTGFGEGSEFLGTKQGAA